MHTAAAASAAATVVISPDLFVPFEIKWNMKVLANFASAAL